MKFPEWLPVYGGTDYRGPCRHEDCEQIDFFAFLKRDWPKYHAVALHPKNEGKRTGWQSSIDKMMGSLNSGASDVIIPGNPAFVCEMKRLDHTKSRWQRGQIEYLESAKNNGAFVCVALGYEAALEAVRDWHEQRVPKQD